MEQRSIGGFKVSVLGLGTGRLASLGAGGSLSHAARLLDAAADLGISFIDTADTYGSTQAERWLGELMHKRVRFVVAAKCGLATVDLPRPLRPLNQPAKKSCNGSADNIISVQLMSGTASTPAFGDCAGSGSSSISSTILRSASSTWNTSLRSLTKRASPAK